MSEAINKMNIVAVADSRVNVETQQTYAIIQGPALSLSKFFSFTSLSTSSVAFNNINPNSMKTFVSRQFDISMTFLVNFVGTAPAGYNLLDSWAQDMAVRALPINNSFTSVSLQINTATFNSDINDVLPYIQRVNFTKNAEYISASAVVLDESQQYSELCNAPNPSNRNPLQAYGVGACGTIPGRGSGQYKMLTNTPTSGSMLLTFSEPLMVSPLVWSGHDTSTSFYHISNVTFEGIFDANLSARILSISNNCVSTFSSISVVPQASTLQFTYFTPSIITKPIPDKINYSYYPIQRYITDVNTPIAGGSGTTVVTNSLQIGSNPKQVIIFVKPTRSTLTTSTTDTYCRINKISLEYMNRPGQFSSTAPTQIFNMSKRNGLDMSWDQWYGHALVPGDLFNTNSKVVSGVGSVIVIDPVLDMGLGGLSTSGSTETNQLQITVDFTSLYRDNTTRLFSIYILVINDGLITLTPGSLYQSDSIVGPNDLLNAKMIEPQYTNQDVLNAQKLAGASFFGDVKKFFGKVGHAIPGIVQHIPSAVGAIKTIAPLLGFGCGMVGGCHGDYNPHCEHCQHVAQSMHGNGLVGGRKMKGQGLVGGKAVSRKSLKALMY